MTELPWYTKGSGHEGIAISRTGHVLVSGRKRRAILCGASKKRVSGKQSATEYKSAAGIPRYEWTITWASHFPIITSAETLLMQTNAVSCRDCRAALERVIDGLPA